MSPDVEVPAAPDLRNGIPSSALPDGATLAGRVGDTSVLLARSGGTVFAVDAECPHRGAPLVDGLVVDGTIRCPWHHAAFDLRTGAPVRPPALQGLGCWRVEERDDRITVGGRITVRRMTPPTHPAARGGTRPVRPSSVVIIGGGAAGSIAAETLRKEGYEGSIALVDAESTAPYDRTTLSKGFLEGTMPRAELALRDAAFFDAHRIRRFTGRAAKAVDPLLATVTLDDGSVLPYGALLLATGAAPERLGAPDPHGRVRYLRSLRDAERLVESASTARTAVIVGASFLGLEAAAALRARGLAVRVVALESIPFARSLGRALGSSIRSLHEAHGVEFHLGTTVRTVEEQTVVLQDGRALDADLVLAAVGVRPRTDLARDAGLAVTRGILVDEYLQTSEPRILAAGDVAYWRDPRRDEYLHAEHWVVAQRQGETAARNILGAAQRFSAIPFFWSQHYDATITYVGHSTDWDHIDVDGSLESRDCTVTYRKQGKVQAVATVFRDRESLLAELAMESELATGVSAVQASRQA